MRLLALIVAFAIVIVESVLNGERLHELLPLKEGQHTHQVIRQTQYDLLFGG